MDVVIVPTFDRPELLHHCLQALAACEEIARMSVRVYLDGRAPARALHEVSDVLEAARDAGGYLASLGLTLNQDHPYPGNSYNTLRAFKDAYDEGAERVYLVEDDVIVSTAFFSWHRARWEDDATWAATIGVPPPAHGAYASLGVCLPRATLAQVTRHARPAYFADMRGYCERRFPASDFDVEQDGLIARVIAGQRVAWAVPRVCAHVGWYGYHRRHTIPPRNESLIDRIRFVGRALEDAALLSVLSEGALDVQPPHFEPEPEIGTSVTTVPGVPL